MLGIAHNFLMRTPDHIAALTDAAREGDLKAISTTAHLIKGSALTFGAPRLVNLCVPRSRCRRPSPAAWFPS